METPANDRPPRTAVVTIVAIVLLVALFVAPFRVIEAVALFEERERENAPSLTTTTRSFVFTTEHPHIDHIAHSHGEEQWRAAVNPESYDEWDPDTYASP